MNRLERITSANIDEIVDEDQVREIGRGSVKPCYNNRIRILTPEEKIIIHVGAGSVFAEKDFSKYLKRVLQQEGLYFAKINEYIVKEKVCLFEGIFYREK